MDREKTGKEKDRKKEEKKASSKNKIRPFDGKKAALNVIIARNERTRLILLKSKKNRGSKKLRISRSHSIYKLLVVYKRSRYCIG